MKTWQEKCKNAAQFQQNLVSGLGGSYDIMCPVVAYSSFKAGTHFAAQELLNDERVRKLLEALNSWIQFEESCIKKDGPYVSDAIPKQINQAYSAVNAFEQLKKEVINE